jgi:hypothetical protein
MCGPGPGRWALAMSQDAAALAILALSAVGPSVRPLLALALGLALRAALVALGGQAAPAASVWDTAAGASVFGTATGEHGVSGAAVLLAVAAFELPAAAAASAGVGGGGARAAAAAAVCLAAVAAAGGALLSLRAVWTVNLALGGVVGRYATLVAARIDPYVEALLP